MIKNPSKRHNFIGIFKILLSLFLLSLSLLLSTSNVSAQDPELNPTKDSFRIVVCDGPAQADPKDGTPYVPCDFNGLMRQVKHLINVMLVLGVLASIIGFVWAGALYLTGKKGNIDRAHSIFPKVLGGLIIMLAAWFIVFQILTWLTKDDGFTTLLGK